MVYVVLIVYTAVGQMEWFGLCSGIIDGTKSR